MFKISSIFLNQLQIVWLQEKISIFFQQYSIL